MSWTISSSAYKGAWTDKTFNDLSEQLALPEEDQPALDAVIADAKSKLEQFDFSDAIEITLSDQGAEVNSFAIQHNNQAVEPSADQEIELLAQERVKDILVQRRAEQILEGIK